MMAIFGTVCPMHTWKPSGGNDTLRIGLQKCVKSSITRRQIVQFCSNLVESLSTWHLMYYKCSGSVVEGQGHSAKMLSVFSLEIGSHWI